MSWSSGEAREIANCLRAQGPAPRFELKAFEINLFTLLGKMSIKISKIQLKNAIPTRRMKTTELFPALEGKIFSKGNMLWPISRVGQNTCENLTKLELQK